MDALEFDLEFSMEAPSGGTIDPGVHNATIVKFLEFEKTAKKGTPVLQTELKTEGDVDFRIGLFAPTKIKEDGSENKYFALSVKSFQQRLSEFFLAFFPKSDEAGAAKKFNAAMAAAKKAGDGKLTLENIGKFLKEALPADYMKRDVQFVAAYLKDGEDYTDLAYGGSNGDVGVFSAHKTRVLTLTKKFTEGLGKNKRSSTPKKAKTKNGATEKTVSNFFADAAEEATEDPFEAKETTVEPATAEATTATEAKTVTAADPDNPFA